MKSWYTQISPHCLPASQQPWYFQAQDIFQLHLTRPKRQRGCSKLKAPRSTQVKAFVKVYLVFEWSRWSAAAFTPCACFPERWTFFLCEIKCEIVRILSSLYTFIFLINSVNDMWPSAWDNGHFLLALWLLCRGPGGADLLPMGLFSDGILLSPNSTGQSLAICHSSSYSYANVCLSPPDHAAAHPHLPHTHRHTHKSNR